MSNITVGILTVSDTCFRQEKENIAGQKLLEVVRAVFPNYSIIRQAIVADEKLEIIKVLNEWIKSSCNLILTTGGTGFGPRDVTPEATRSVIDREAPGLAYAMIAKSLAITPMAMLSRAVCGIKDKSILVNLPGSTKGATECFSFIIDALPHALALITDNQEAIKSLHQNLQARTENPTAQVESCCKTHSIPNQDISIDKYGPSKVKIDIVNRPRESPFPLIEVETASKIIFKECAPFIEIEDVPIEKALGRILAEDIYSQEPFPPFNASLFDGYAIRHTGSTLKTVIKSAAAGDDSANIELKNEEAVRICTGAAVPKFATSVVPVENTTIWKKSENGEEELQINISYFGSSSGIRLKGSDIPENTKIFSKNERLTAAHIGILAAIPKLTIRAYKLPMIGILSTGNEIVNYSVSPKFGQIRDTNRITLQNLLKESQFCSLDFGIAKDNPDEIKNKIAEALTHCDVVISTGGVSMGEYDLIKNILEQDFDAVIHFGRVNMKPGKPTTFATLLFNGKRKVFFGLPGNPVSAGVTCLLFVIPLLKYLSRIPCPQFPEITFSQNKVSWNNTDSRPEFIRVILSKNNDGTYTAISTGSQISSRLNSLAGANALVRLPPNLQNIDSGRAIVFGNILYDSEMFY